MKALNLGLCGLVAWGLVGVVETPAQASGERDFLVSVFPRFQPQFLRLSDSGKTESADLSLDNLTYQVTAVSPNSVQLNLSRVSFDTLFGNPLFFTIQITSGQATGQFDGTQWNLFGTVSSIGIGFNSAFTFGWFWGVETLPPPNDDFANRTILRGLPARDTGYAPGATTELGEPEHGGPARFQGTKRTLWWSWTAPQSNRMQVYSDFSFISVYTGNALENLTEVATSQLGIPWAHFDAQAGTTYHVVLMDSPYNLSGIFQRPMSITLAP